MLYWTDSTIWIEPVIIMDNDGSYTARKNDINGEAGDTNA